MNSLLLVPRVLVLPQSRYMLHFAHSTLDTCTRLEYLSGALLHVSLFLRLLCLLLSVHVVGLLCVPDMPCLLGMSFLQHVLQLPHFTHVPETP